MNRVCISVGLGGLAIVLATSVAGVWMSMAVESNVIPPHSDGLLVVWLGVGLSMVLLGGLPLGIALLWKELMRASAPKGLQ